MGEFLRRMESMEQRYEQRASAAKCGGTGGLDWVRVIFVAGPGRGALATKWGGAGWLASGQRGWHAVWEPGEKIMMGENDEDWIGHPLLPRSWRGGRWMGGLEEWKAGYDNEDSIAPLLPRR